MKDVGELMTRWLSLSARLAQARPGSTEYGQLLREVSEARQAYERAVNGAPDVTGNQQRTSERPRP